MLQSSWKRSGWLSLGPEQVYYKRNRILKWAKEIGIWAFIIVQAKLNEENGEQAMAHPLGLKVAETYTLERSSASSQVH
jgi:hypothetical protein